MTVFSLFDSTRIISPEIRDKKSRALFNLGTILETDPYKVSPDAVAGITVSETWVAGEKKFG